MTRGRRPNHTASAVSASHAATKPALTDIEPASTSGPMAKETSRSTADRTAVRQVRPDAGMSYATNTGYIMLPSKRTVMIAISEPGRLPVIKYVAQPAPIPTMLAASPTTTFGAICIVTSRI